TKYCARCDQPGNAEDMEQLYNDPADDKPSRWLHVECRNAHGRKILAADMTGPGSGHGNMAMDEASGSVIALERTRGLSILAAHMMECAGAPEKLEHIRAEKARQGIDPSVEGDGDDQIRGHARVARSASRLLRRNGNDPEKALRAFTDYLVD